jgi:hypothetical protein
LAAKETNMSDVWVQTYTGKVFDLLEPEAYMVDIQDIAVSLSRLNRFKGHTRLPITVAQHSVDVSRLVPDVDAKWGLLHDAAEAYIGDMPGPLKRWLGPGDAFLVLEAHVMRAICDCFGLSRTMPSVVAQADMIMLATEQRDLMGPPPRDWGPMSEPREEKIVPLQEGAAWFAFVGRWYELGGE